MSESASSRPSGVQLITPEPRHAGELGRICYEAFKDIADRHGFPPDFPSVQVARSVIGMLIERPDFYGVAALADGELAGSNYLSFSDPVAGLGPITVDCAFQGRDIGRALMQNVIDYARRNAIQRVRLLQDAYNTASISLYSSLGFEVKHATAFMRMSPAAKPDASVRPVQESDLPALDALCQRNYKASRRNELASAVQGGLSPFTRQRDGRLTGYLIPGIFGHGVAESVDDAVTIAAQSARLMPPDRMVCFSPLDDRALFAAFLKAGFRTIKILNLMAMGPYEEPASVWMPSILY